MGDDKFTTLGRYLQKSYDEKRDSEAKRGLRWGALGVILALIAGAFGLGFTASSTVTKAEIEQLKLIIQKLEQNQDKLRKEFKTSGKKEEFRTLACRIKKSKEALARSPLDKSLQQEVKANVQALATFIDQNVDQEKDEDGIPVMRIVKGETPPKSVVKFAGDDALYLVPPEVKKETKVATWIKGNTNILENLQIYSPRCPKWEPVSPDPRIRQPQLINIELVRVK